MPDQGTRIWIHFRHEGVPISLIIEDGRSPGCLAGPDDVDFARRPKRHPLDPVHLPGSEEGVPEK